MIGKLLLLGGAALGIGAAAKAGLFEGPKARRARKELGAAFRRIPLPHIILHLPTTVVELDSLDAALCECALSSGAAAAMDRNELLSLAPQIQKCTAELLFPEIDWPPVHSDNPTIHQYWSILDQRLRRLIFSGELAQFCGLGAVAPAPEVTNMDPTSVQVQTAPLVRLQGSFSPNTTVALQNGAGRSLSLEVRTKTNETIELVVDADEPGSYDLVVSNGPNPASSIVYSDAFVIVHQQQE